MIVPKIRSFPLFQVEMEHCKTLFDRRSDDVSAVKLRFLKQSQQILLFDNFYRAYVFYRGAYVALFREVQSVVASHEM